MSDTSATRKRKVQRDAEQKRRQQLYILIGIVVVAVLAIFVIILITQQGVGAQQTASAIAESSTYANYTPGTSEEGLPQLGSPDAPMVIREYSSFGCPHCANFHDTQVQNILSDIAAGEVRLIYIPITNSFSMPASAAAFCAWDQGRFWEMHDILFSYLEQFGNNAFGISNLRSAAEQLGLDMDAFNACLTSADTGTRIDQANSLFAALNQQYPNVTGTPTVTFNGTPPSWGSGWSGDIRAYIQGLMAG